MITFKEFKGNNVFVILRNKTDLEKFKKWLKCHDYDFLEAVDRYYQEKDFIAKCHNGYCAHDTLAEVLNDKGKFVYIENLEPFKPKYDWVKIKEIQLNGYLGDIPYISKGKNDVEFEILFNYIRYRKQFDDVELDGKIAYRISHDVLTNKYVINYSNVFKYDGTHRFSTNEHAENFIGLLKENVK